MHQPIIRTSTHLNTRTHSHQCHFVDHELPVFFVVWSTKFQSKLLFICFTLDTKDFCKSANTKLVLAVDIVVRRRILVFPYIMFLHLFLEPLGWGQFFLLFCNVVRCPHDRLICIGWLYHDRCMKGDWTFKHLFKVVPLFLLIEIIDHYIEVIR